MKRNVVLSGLVVSLAACWLAGAATAQDKDKDKPKMTIKEVMKLHGKDKLKDTYIAGKATKEEKAKLLEAYEALGKNKPPKGDEKDWKEKTDALVKAMKDDDVEAFKKAVNCKDCHTAHKKS